MTKNVELLGSYWTLAGDAQPHTDKEYSPFDFKDRVESAAKAGFKGIGIWHADLAHVLKAGLGRDAEQQRTEATLAMTFARRPAADDDLLSQDVLHLDSGR